MHPHQIHRAQQCPRPGCTAWALLSTPEQVADEGEPLWRCGSGHRGPRILAESAVDGVIWSDRPWSAGSEVDGLR